MTSTGWAILLVVVGTVTLITGLIISSVTPLGMVLTVPGGLMLGAGIHTWAMQP